MKQQTELKLNETERIHEEWEESRIGDCAELIYGKSLPERQRKKGNIPVFGSNGIVGFHDEAIVKGPGIIIGRKGSVGEITFSKQDFWPIDTTYYVQTKHGNDICFWYYFLKTLGLNQMNTHSAVPGLNRDNVYEIVRAIPNFIEQRAIASILSSLDDKIALNHQMNSTLEAIGQALFKHWFVDFEFPNEGGKPYRSSGGEMVETELGEVPRGWEVIKLSEIAEFTRGFSYAGSEKSKVSGEYVFITLNSIYEGGGFKREFSYLTSERVKERHLIKEWDIIIANTEQTKTGTLLGFPALVEFPPNYDKKVGVFSHHITKVVSSHEEVKHFLYQYLHFYQSKAIKYHTGSVIWALDVNGWSNNERIMLPNMEILVKFSELMNTIFQRRLTNNRDSNTLENIRDALLPKLMSGEIRVRAE